MLIGISYVLLSSPNQIAVTDSGEITGLINNARVSIQGVRFWKGQLRLINTEIKKERSKIELAAGIDNVLKMMEEINSKKTEELYRQHPELRPSPAELQAEQLRNLADEIESAEASRKIVERRLNRIWQLQQLIPVVEAKIK